MQTALSKCSAVSNRALRIANGSSLRWCSQPAVTCSTFRNSWSGLVRLARRPGRWRGRQCGLAPSSRRLSWCGRLTPIRTAARRYPVNRFEERVATAAKRSSALSGAWQKCCAGRGRAHESPTRTGPLVGTVSAPGISPRRNSRDTCRARGFTIRSPVGDMRPMRSTRVPCTQSAQSVVAERRCSR